MINKSKRGLLLVMVLLTISAMPLLGQVNSSITFIENKGQWPAAVKFSAEIPGGMLFVEKSTLTYSFSDPEQAMARAHNSHLSGQSIKFDSLSFYAMKVDFLEARDQPEIIAAEAVPTLYNYFYGQDSTSWATAAKGYKKIIVKDLYDGIDLEIYADVEGVKYDLRLGKNANPACIQMKYSGATALAIEDEKLRISTPFQVLEEQIPATYALCEDKTRSLSSRYLLTEDIVSFEIGQVEDGESVLIDPLLVFSTYSGSAADNWGNTATYDDSGNGYAGGMTNPVRGGEVLGEFPATAGAYQTASAGGWDVAILKFDSTGQNLLYATYLGGSGTDTPQSLLVNEAGELLILGLTGSSDFPVTTNAYDKTFNGGPTHQLLGGVDFDHGSDLFVAKLSADGSRLLASTYVGGTANDGMIPRLDLLAKNYGDESRGDIGFDSKGNILIASRTNSPDFPVLNGYQGVYGGGSTDAVLFKLSAVFDALIWGTYLGGNAADVALSVKLDSSDNIFVAGGTASTDFPTTPNTLFSSSIGDVDGWVAHISESGDSLISSTFIGTTGYDQVFFLDLDANEEVYLAGQTNGAYPISSGVYSSGVSGQFIHKLSNDLQSSVFSTAINVPGRVDPAISLTAFLVNDCNNIYLSGWGSQNDAFAIEGVNSNNFRLNTNGLPVTAEAYQSESDGSSFYLMVLSGDAAELLYGTHLGDANSLVHVDGGTSRFDKHGIVYHSVCASCFGDSSFPTTAGAYATQNGSTGCNNALFKFDLASLRARIQTNSIDLTDPGLSGGCLPLDVAFENLSTGGEIYEWDFGDGTTLSTTSSDTIIHQYQSAGIFQVQLRAFDPNTCISEDYAYTSVRVSAPDFSVSATVDICAGNSTPLLATGGTQYLWSPTEGLDDPTRANPIASPTDTTTYTVEIVNSNGCNFEDQVTVNVAPQIVANIWVEQSGLCNGSREISILNESENAAIVSWVMGDGSVLTDWQPVYNYTKDGEYMIIGKLIKQQCALEVELNVKIQQLNIPNVLTRNADGINDVFVISSVSPVDLAIYTRWGTKVFSQQNYQNDWQGQGLVSGIYYYEVVLKNFEVCSGWIQLLDGN